MSVAAEISTRFRTNVLTVPIASVTTRLPKEKEKDKKNGSKEPAATNIIASSQSSTNACATNTIDTAKSDKKPKTTAKPMDVVF